MAKNGAPKKELAAVLKDAIDSHYARRPTDPFHLEEAIVSL